MGLIRTDEIPRVFTENVAYIRLIIPTQRAPDRFIHIIIASFGIAEKTNRVRRELAIDAGHLRGLRIDRLAGFSQRESRIPIRHWILAMRAVRDVRVRQLFAAFL